MTETVFVDTNVLIYAADPADLLKQKAALVWQAALWKSRRGRISYQVLQEFYAKVTQKWPHAREWARAQVRDLLTWQPVSPQAALLDRTWRIQDRYRFSFWDALIVAAAEAAGCRYLLTEDLQSGQNLEGLLVINPFVLTPSELNIA